MASKNHIVPPFFEDRPLLRYCFNQNWSLFVPPPQFNKKLYYTFYKKGSNERITFEVFANLLKLKSGKAPFNGPEGIEEDILSYSQNSVIWWMENFRENNDENADAESSQAKLDFVQSTYSYQVLKGYSLFVAKQNNLPIDDYEVSFTVVRVSIPEFEEREKLMDEAFVFQEEVMFKSEKFPLVP